MDTVNLIFAGHLDGGKSTLVGRIFYERGEISERLLKRLARHAAAAGKPTHQFAFFTDTKLDERQRGVTVEATHKLLEIDGRRFNVIDSPGHRDYVKNMITGAAQADAAVLVVDAKETAAEGLMAQTKEHLVILDALGVGPLVVAVNKMDAAGYGRDAFDRCRSEIERFRGEVKLDAAGAVFVPVSALEGENVAKPSAKLPWYDGAPLLDALHAVPLPARPVDLPLRMPILRAFSVPGEGAVVAGRIEAGRVAPGDRVVIAPYPGSGGIAAEVGSIEWQHSRVESASAGEEVSVLLTDPEAGFVARQVKKGAVLGGAGDPPKAAARFKAEVRVVDHTKGIRERYSPHLHVHQAATPCTIEEVLHASGPDGATVFERPPACAAEAASSRGDSAGPPPLTNGFTFTAWMRPQKPLVIERADSFPRLGRLVLRDGRTVATGRCVEAEHA